MLAILKKEINTFFASLMAYLVIGTFLIVNGLFLWVFKGNFNIFDNGIASLNSFFQLAPWVLLFLAPAVTMRSFSDERKQGTFELLLTKPISHFEIVLGKYFGALLLIIIAILPTVFYIYTITVLMQENSYFDYGSTIGSYLGLLFLIASYCAIGLFCSVLTDNQIVAFISAVFLCFIFYFAFEGLSNYKLLGDTIYLESIGMSAHYKSISRGIIDTRDVIYFLSITAGFLMFTKLKIQNK